MPLYYWPGDDDKSVTMNAQDFPILASDVRRGSDGFWEPPDPPFEAGPEDLGRKAEEELGAQGLTRVVRKKDPRTGEPIETWADARSRTCIEAEQVHEAWLHAWIAPILDRRAAKVSAAKDRGMKPPPLTADEEKALRLTQEWELAEKDTQAATPPEQGG